MVALIEYAYRVPQKSENLVKDLTLLWAHKEPIDQKVEVTNVVPRVKRTLPTSVSTQQNYWTEKMSKT